MKDKKTNISSATGRNLAVGHKMNDLMSLIKAELSEINDNTKAHLVVLAKQTKISGFFTEESIELLRTNIFKRQEMAEDCLDFFTRVYSQLEFEGWFEEFYLPLMLGRAYERSHKQWAGFPEKTTKLIEPFDGNESISDILEENGYLLIMYVMVLNSHMLIGVI